MSNSNTLTGKGRAAGVQLNFGIDFAPEQMRRYGLREAHTYPLVSQGKIGGGPYVSKRVAAVDAWDWPEVEQRTPNSWPLLSLDLDGRDAVARINQAMIFGQIAPPSWYTVRRASGGLHAFWALRRPVLRGAQALRRPLREFGRIAEWYQQALDADAGYSAVLSHNAAYTGGEFATDWLTPDAFTLAGLAAAIPKGWRRPPPAALRSAISRNCALFEAGMGWAGSPHRREAAIMPVLSALNREFDWPLPEPEVAAIARSIEGYRARWIADGRYYDHSSAEQADRGRKSGRSRRRQTADRDREIAARFASGETWAALAAEFGMSVGGIRYILRRDDAGG